MLNIGSSGLILGANFHIVVTKQFGKIWENFIINLEKKGVKLISMFRI